MGFPLGKKTTFLFLSRRNFSIFVLMVIETYISELLYRYDCVILPGFGAFITRHQSARILVATNEFLPPQKSVSFNSQLTKNDGLLANHVMEVEQISFKEAVYKLALYAEELNTVLKQDKEADLEGLGRFLVTEEDKLQFEPLANKNYLKEAFGLSSYTSAIINREHDTSAEVGTQEAATIQLNTEKRNSRPYLKYAAIGLLAIGLGGYTGINLYSTQVAQHNLAEQQKAETQLGQQIQRATFVIDNPLPAITLNVDRQSGKYHVVAGAFRMAENAENHVQELQTDGYNARLIGENRYGLHQVVYSSYEARRDAINALNKVKRESNAGAWLLVEEL